MQKRYLMGTMEICLLDKQRVHLAWAGEIGFKGELMDEEPINKRESISRDQISATKASAWPWIAVALLACAVIIVSVFYFREQGLRQQQAAANSKMDSDLSQ